MSTDAIRLGTFAVGSEQWHAVREGALGGSEIAAVLGLSPWESRFSLWHRKLGFVPPVVANEAMRWGRRLEEPIARVFTELHPDYRVRRTGTWRNRSRPWQIANPDRDLHGPDGREVLEIKCARDALGWGQPGTGEVPVHYRAQVLWYLDALGLSRAHIAVLIAGRDYREYVVDYSSDEVAVLRAAAADFISSLESDQPPNIDEHGATYQMVREMHPEIDDVEIEISATLAEQYRAALSEHKAAEARKRRATAQVAHALGRGRRAVCAGESIAVRVPGRGTAPPALRPSPVRLPPQRVSAA